MPSCVSESEDAECHLLSCSIYEIQWRNFKTGSESCRECDYLFLHFEMQFQWQGEKVGIPSFPQTLPPYPHPTPTPKKRGDEEDEGGMFCTKWSNWMILSESCCPLNFWCCWYYPHLEQPLETSTMIKMFSMMTCALVFHTRSMK